MTPRPQGPWERRAQEDAAARGLTREEYGVYKGDYGAVVQPINSVGGLLFLAILLTACAGTIVVATIVSIVAPGDTPQSRFDPLMLGYDALGVLVAGLGWGYFLKELKASRLRKARGKTLDFLPEGAVGAVPSPAAAPQGAPPAERGPSPALRTVRRVLGWVLFLVGAVLEITVVFRALWLLISWTSLDLLWNGLWLALLAAVLMFAGLRLRASSTGLR